MANQQGQESAQQADRIRSHSFPESEFGKLAGPHSGQFSMQWGDQRQDSQGSCTLAWMRRSSSGNPRRQHRKRKWRRRMERRQYRRKQLIRTAMMDQEEASKEQHQTGGKISYKVHSSTGEGVHDASSDYRYSQRPYIWIFA